MIRFKYFVHFKQIWSVFNWKPTVLMSPQNFFKNSPNLPETKKLWKWRVKTRSFFSMTPTGLWKSCGWTSNTRSAGEKFQNAFLVHRGTGVSVLAGPCLSAVIEWTIQRSWVGPYLKFWLVEILKGTTGFPSYQDIVYVLWTRISAYPKPEGTLSPHLDLPPYPKSQSPPGCCYIFRLGNPKRNSPKTSKLIKTLWQHHLWSVYMKCLADITL